MTTTNYETVSSKNVYEGKIFTVRADEVKMPDGNVARRDVVSKDNAVAIVALDDHGNIALVNQYRHPVGERLWELPAGLIDNPGEGPLQTAQRELHEEVGYTAADWAILAEIAASPGFTDERTTIYLAHDLTFEGRPEATDEEADLVIEWVPVDTALGWVREGKIVNAHTVAGVLATVAYSYAELDPKEAS